jgi:RHS repeat-associated protein
MDNPCTTTVEAFRQAGRPKGKIEADPDGAGPETGRKSETIYNESGETVATRYNSDPWSCTEYDVRGRIAKVIVPGRIDREGRTVTNNYAVGGNPLITSSSDSSGTITLENDLLGRTVKYIDAKGKTTQNTYDSYNKLISRTSPIGVESYEFDNYDRLIKQKLDGVVFATVAYDEYSRLVRVDYPAGLSLSSITRDTLGRENGNTYTFASGQQLTDTITRYASGDVKSGNENGLAKSYNYDKAGRLTGATIGSNTYGYEFGSPDASCAATLGYNGNTARNGNRTKLTVNGQSTTYCYDSADRLISSSDVTLTDAKYDDHGNTISLGDAAHKTEFTYDAIDRNTGVKAATKETKYSRDVQGRVVAREYKNNGIVASSVSYGFTGAGDTPDFLLNSAGEVIQKYVTLPGDVLVTIKTQSQSAGATTISLPNIHGDIFATVNADGALLSTFATGPFGETLPIQLVQPASALLSAASPTNTADGTTYQYVGQYQKLTDIDASSISGGVTQMGARVYLPTLGRFLQVDPVEGGTDNNYAYANDPVNEYDLGGNLVETIADVAGIGYDAYEMYKKPSWGNAGMLAWSVGATLIPFVPGSYAGRAGSAAFKAAKGAVPVMTKKIVSTSSKVGSVAKSVSKKIIKAVTKERYITKNIRISPLGNWGAKHGDGTPNWAARLPHVHIKKAPQPNRPEARTSMRWHRPWQTIFRKWFK